MRAELELFGQRIVLTGINRWPMLQHTSEISLAARYWHICCAPSVVDNLSR
jgi:hypothetical protein